MAIDPVLTASFQADAYKFMLNNLVAVRGLTVSETLETDDGKSVKRPTFPNLPTSPAPAETDNQRRAEKNYAIKDPIILSAGIERDARYDTITNGKTSRQLYNLRIFPPNTGGAFPIYYLPYSDNMAYTMALRSGGTAPQLFCTEAINGCTFQVGGTPAVPVVTHANVQGGSLSLDTKAQFLEFYLEPPRVGAERIANSVLPARLQRFASSSTATVDPNSVVEYGAAATAAFGAATMRTFHRPAGIETFTHKGKTYESKTYITDIQGKPLEPTGGEVAVVGANPRGNLWAFWWSMYLPAKFCSMFYEITPGSGGRNRLRTLVDSIIRYDFIPIVNGRFLWPDWYAGTPYSTRLGNLGR